MSQQRLRNTHRILSQQRKASQKIYRSVSQQRLRNIHRILSQQRKAPQKIRPIQKKKIIDKKEYA
ncbi:MAG TPA: DUF3136 domain-containing protein [Candidatus Coprocola pullicola]|nr:DUF3136 domain-containing protein [Candidatus Coprocola pullicola]